MIHGADLGEKGVVLMGKYTGNKGSSVRHRWSGVWFLCAAIVAALPLAGAWARWLAMDQLMMAWFGLAALLTIAIPWVARWSRTTQSRIAFPTLAWLGCAVGVFCLVNLVVSVHKGATLLQLVKLTGLIGLFLYSAVYAGSEHRLRTLVTTIVCVSTAAMAIAIILYAAVPSGASGALASLADALVVRDPAGRLSAFFSYANALAGFLIPCLCIAVGMAAFGNRPLDRVVGVVGLTVQSTALVLTQSRGGLLVAAGLLLLLPIAARMLRLVTLRQFRPVAVAYGIGVAAVLVSLAIPALRESIWWPVIQRFRLAIGGLSVSPGVAGDESLRGRWQMMHDAIPYFRAYPIAGSGLGTYPSVYMKFRSSMFFATDPHSLVLKLLTETGIVGTSLAAALAVVLLSIGFRAVECCKDRALVFAVMVGLAGGLMHSCIDIDSMFYVFDVLSAILLGSAAGIVMHAGTSWWLMARQVHSQIEAAAEPTLRSAHRARAKPVHKSRRWATALAFLVAMTCFMACASTTAAEAMWLSGQLVPSTVSVFVSVERCRVAGLLNPWHSKYPRTLAELAGNALDNVTQEAQFALWNDAKSAYERAMSLDPLNPAIQMQYAQFLYAHGDREAVHVFERLTETDPVDPGVWTSLAHAHLALNHKQELVQDALEHARRLDAEYYDIDNVQGEMALNSGDTIAAEVAYRRSASANPSQQTAWLGLVEVYQKTRQEGKLVAALFDASINALDGSSFSVQLQQLAPVALWVSPSPGIAVKPGDAVELRWLVTGKASLLDGQSVYLVPEAGAWTPVAQGLSPDTRSLVWKVPTTFPPGSYRFRVYLGATSLMRGADRTWASYAVSTPIQVAK